MESKRRPKGERERLLARIHILAQELGMDEETYRAALAGWNARSAGDLALSQLRQLVRFLERETRKRERRHSYPGRPKNMDLPDRGRQMAKVEALLTDMGLPWRYADRIAARMYGVEKVEWLRHADQRQGVITALVKEARRRQRWLKDHREAVMEACAQALGQGQREVEITHLGHREATAPRICPGGPRGRNVGTPERKGCVRARYDAGELLYFIENWTPEDPAR